MRARPAGLTLVELLAVIAIVAVLMGLLLPAVQAARETAGANRSRRRSFEMGLPATMTSAATAASVIWPIGRSSGLRTVAIGSRP